MRETFESYDLSEFRVVQISFRGGVVQVAYLR